ncbi:MAG: hypothetical protein RLZZ175_93 [Bacteroidota bacterium]
MNVIYVDMRVDLKGNIIIIKQNWFRDFVFNLVFVGLISLVPSLYHKSYMMYIVLFLTLSIIFLILVLLIQLFVFSKVEINNATKSILLTKSFLGIQIQSKTYLNFNVELLGFSNGGKLNNNVLIYYTLKLIKLDLKNKYLILSQIDMWKTGYF